MRFLLWNATILVFTGLELVSISSYAADSNSDHEWKQLEKYFNDDWENKARAVNEGELVFSTSIDHKQIYGIETYVTIANQSLVTGWVTIRQCHSGLDRVPSLEITYLNREMKNLRVIDASNIAKAWIENNSVQLNDIENNASICVGFETKILVETKPGNWQIKQGPYYRRFLDGYYPMHSKILMEFPPDKLHFDRSSISPQTGLSITPAPGRVLIDAYFSGRFEIVIYFH